MTRNPLDYMVSSYFYFYRNRGKVVPLKMLWKKILTPYISNEIAFSKIIREQPETTILLRYEDVVNNPKTYFSLIINHFDFIFDEVALGKAISDSQKEKIKDIENAGGGVIVAGGNFQAKSFIRSGKVGEWREYIDPAFASKIRSYLEKQGVDTEIHIYS